MNRVGKMPTYPNIETPFHQLKWQTSLLVSHANPDLRVHQQAMMQICDPLLDTRRAVVDWLPLLAPPPLQSMYP